MKPKIRNQWRSITALLILLIGINSTNAQDFSVDGIFYNVTSATEPYEVEVTSGDVKYSGDVVIPGSVTYNDIEYSVTAIGYRAFRYCSGLTSIEIPNSVTSIGNAVFSDCYGLTSIEIPNSVTSIGSYVFSSCYRLTSIAVEEGNPVYDSRENCNAIIETASNRLIAGCKNSFIPNSVTAIGKSAFYNCDGLTSIVIPNSVTAIGYEAFYGCSILTSIVIPNSVTVIDDDAFSYCSSLISINIPNSVTSIGNSAFFRCNDLTSIIVEEGNLVYDSRENCNAIIETATNKLIAG